MRTAVSLPVTVLDPRSPRLQVHTPRAQAQRPLPKVETRERKGPMLHASPLSDNSEVLSLNLAMGCGHRCAFCSVRAFPSYPGDDVVYLFANTAERLNQELAHRRRQPRAVIISPSTDPFPPLAEVQAETARVVAVLAKHGIEAWLLTRGYIRPSILQVLEAHRQSIRVTVGLTTVNRVLQRVLEPLAAPPRLRFRQIARLEALGISVRVALEPLIPGLTDTRANLEELLEELAALGVRRVTAGYIFLRQGIRDNLVRALEPYGWDKMVLEAFADGAVLKAGQVAPARYLSKAKRQHRYAALMALAAERGIAVRLSAVTNPDFGPPRGQEANHSPRQQLLPMF